MATYCSRPSSSTCRVPSTPPSATARAWAPSPTTTPRRRCPSTTCTLVEGNSGTTGFSLHRHQDRRRPSSRHGRLGDRAAAPPRRPAAPGVDYISASGTLTIPAGDPRGRSPSPSAATLVPEANETFNVNLSAATNATISDGSGLGTITNDDAAPVLAIDDVTVDRGQQRHDRRSPSRSPRPAPTELHGDGQLRDRRRHRDRRARRRLRRRPPAR